MRVDIIPATFRDLTYIASRMRAEDREEAEAQLGPVHYMDIAAMHLGPHAFVATLSGNPEAAFGVTPYGHLGIAWSWGSKRIGRCAPTIARDVRERLIPLLIGQGARRVEARALATHTSARTWLKRMGATERCVLPAYGRGGEDFVLYDWVNRDVLLQAGHSQAEAAGPDPDRG